MSESLLRWVASLCTYLSLSSSAALLLSFSYSTQLHYDGAVIATFACSTIMEREEWLKAFDSLKSQSRLNPMSQGRAVTLMYLQLSVVTGELERFVISLHTEQVMSLSVCVC